MASSVLKLYKNALMNSQPARNLHFSSQLFVDDLLKKKPTELEKRLTMTLKFFAVFLPGVYAGYWMTKKGYLNSDKKKVKAKKVPPPVIDTKKLDEKANEVIDKVADTIKPDPDKKKK